MEQAYTQMMAVFELIDTCWDVNYFDSKDSAENYFELIDTCWDVNFDY